MEAVPLSPSNIGWLECKLSSLEVNYIWECIENSKKVCMKNALAGNIDSSFELVDKGRWFFDNSLIPLCRRFMEAFGTSGTDFPGNGRHPYFLKDFWVNYQNQGEFNPLHNHTGVYSFAIWMRIPTHWKEQVKLPFLDGVPEANKRVSSFEFQYIDALGGIRGFHYPLSPENEGMMLFFPSKLKHQVYPFYNSEETRISVAGNIGIDTTIVV